MPGLGCGAVRVYSYGDVWTYPVHIGTSVAGGGPGGGTRFPSSVTAVWVFSGEWSVPRFLRVLVSCGGFEFGGGAVMITSPQSTLSL